LVLESVLAFDTFTLAVYSTFAGNVSITAPLIRRMLVKGDDRDATSVTIILSSQHFKISGSFNVISVSSLVGLYYKATSETFRVLQQCMYKRFSVTRCQIIRQLFNKSPRLLWV